jgi:hypothetical protein
VWFQIIIIFQDETQNLQGIYTFLWIQIYFKNIKIFFWIIGEILIIFCNKLQNKSFKIHSYEKIILGELGKNMQS